MIELGFCDIPFYRNSSLRSDINIQNLFCGVGCDVIHHVLVYFEEERFFLALEMMFFYKIERILNRILW